MKAYLLSFRFEGDWRNNQVHYKLVYAFTYEQAKSLLIKDLENKGEILTPCNISNETIEYTI